MTITAIIRRLEDLLTCPISLAIMKDPVIDPCGHTFDRLWIHSALLKKQECPISRQPLRVHQLAENRLVMEAIEWLHELQPNTESDIVPEILSDAYRMRMETLRQHLGQNWIKQKADTCHDACC